MAKARRKNKTKRNPFPEIDVTPEFAAKHGGELVPAIKGGVVGGRKLYSTWRRATPIERIKALSDHEKQAGAYLYQLFHDAGMEGLRASDPAKEFVDGQGATGISERVMDAKDKYHAAIRCLMPMQMQIVREIVIVENSLSKFCNEHRCDIRSVTPILQLSLQQLSLHFGFSSINYGNTDKVA